MAVIIVFSTLLSSFAFYAYQMLQTPNILVDRADRSFIIEKGATFKDVQNALYDGGYVNDLVSFSFLAKLMNYDESVKYGHYVLRKNMSNTEAIRMLRAGLQVPVTITFNNVRLINELPEKLSKYIALSEAELETLLLNDSVANAYGFSSNSFVSMFIPNTYEVYWTVSGKELLDRMHNEYEMFWSDKRREKAKALNMTPVQVSTLASIVQAESIKKEESARIAGLYVNRLKRGIPLQADPTLVFAMGDFTIKRILNKDREVNSPYNTYLNPGLPPGPINMPTIHSIDAVLNHEEHKFLYMCAKEDFSGYHAFATNLVEHNANARRFQAALNKAKIYR